MFREPAKTRRNPLGGAVIALVAAALLCGLLRSPNREEHLLELPRGAGIGPSGGFVAVQGNRVYFSQYRRRQPFALASVSLQDGPRTSQELPSGFGPRPPDTIQLYPDRIVYLANELLARPPGNPGLSPTSDFRDLNAPREPPAPLRPDAEPVTTVERRRAWWIPLAGGMLQELLPEERTPSLQVSGGHCYWVRRPTRATNQPAGALPVGELLAKPLDRGATRRIGRVPENLSLLPCGDGICWRMGTGRHSALFTAGPPDFAVEAFPGFPQVAAPAWIGDRLYWLDGSAPVPPGDPPRGRSLVSTRRDGSDRQVLYDIGFSPDAYTQINELLSDGQDLYFCADRSVRGKHQRRILRYRLTERRIEQLLQTSTPALRPLGTDSGYLYLVSWEERENWFDWSPQGLLRRRVGILHRILLPA